MAPAPAVLRPTQLAGANGYRISRSVRYWTRLSRRTYGQNPLLAPIRIQNWAGERLGCVSLARVKAITKTIFRSNKSGGSKGGASWHYHDTQNAVVLSVAKAESDETPLPSAANLSLSAVFPSRKRQRPFTSFRVTSRRGDRIKMRPRWPREKRVNAAPARGPRGARRRYRSDKDGRQC